MQTDNRIHPRISLTIPIRLVAPDNNSLTATSHNISLGGIVLETDSTVHKELIATNSSDNMTQYKLAFTLPHQNKSLQLNTRVVYVRRLSQNLFHIGLRFVEPNEQSRKLIENYVKSHL